MVAMVAKDAELTTFVGQGELTADELLAADSHFLDTGASPLTLWDFAAASLKRIDVRALRRLARSIVLGAKERRPPGKAAIECSQPLDLGIARMMATYLSMEGYPARLQAFMDLSSATAWLSDVDRK